MSHQPRSKIYHKIPKKEKVAHQSTIDQVVGKYISLSLFHPQKPPPCFQLEHDRRSYFNRMVNHREL